MLTQRITVQRVTQDGTADEFGDPTEQTTYATYNGYVWQTSATEQTDRGQIEREGWQLMIDPGAAGALSAGDRIFVDATLDGDGAPTGGIPFELTGPPWPAKNPRTKLTEFVRAPLGRSA